MKVEEKPKLRRVRKQDVKVDTWVQPDGYDKCLECWTDWMCGDSDRDLGAKTMRGLMGDSDGYGGDPEEAQQARNNRIAVATNAMIDSLKRIHIWAVYAAHGIGTVWDFPNADLITTYAAARNDLEQKLRKNSCTSVLF